ncbi:MAG: 4-alpha-glucanotransferase, partial [Clostridiales Family XIII bacterium]|nr:4-alpha-glucanotransferase [Clostridiales Family XIII bacterium]
MSEISIYHNSRLPEYRNPFGAVVCGASVDLSADVTGDFHSCDCKLHVWLQNRGELLFPLSPAPSQRERAGDGSRAGKRFHILYTVPDTPGLIWYYFIVTCDGQTYFYGNNDEGYGGEGKESFVPPRSYQITVYRYSPVPDWWKEGLVYQIYVDRFARGKDWKQRVWDAQGSGSRRGPTRLLQMDWRDTPFICRDDQGRVERWPFFGGTLDGVREKLSYLKGLGVTIIYLNPIFEAASNHKYDTGDYMRIDPGYGDEESFRLLAKEASEWGISLILDGVFSHSGADSVYFNIYGIYPGDGACLSSESRWYPLYRFERYPDSYVCWWG